MYLGERLRTIRTAKDLSQGDIQARTGLFRCYVSRVECGHTVPSLETLEKLARALQVPLYQLFYESDASPLSPRVFPESRNPWEDSRAGRHYLKRMVEALSQMPEKDRSLLMFVAKKMVRKTRQGQRN